VTYVTERRERRPTMLAAQMQAELKKRHGELSGGRPMVQNPTVPTPSSSDLTDWLPSPNGEPIAAYDNAGEEGTPAIRTVA
jgi:hypothetical protein